MAKVTGIGGVFFKSATDSKALAAWYEKHLGMKVEEWGGAILDWRKDRADDGGVTVWCLAAPDSDWFSPSESPLMINYRVDNLDELLEQLRAAGRRSSAVPRRTKTASSPGSWTRKTPRWNCGSRWPGTGPTPRADAISDRHRGPDARMR